MGEAFLVVAPVVGACLVFSCLEDFLTSEDDLFEFFSLADDVFNWAVCSFDCFLFGEEPDESCTPLLFAVLALPSKEHEPETGFTSLDALAAFTFSFCSSLNSEEIAPFGFTSFEEAELFDNSEGRTSAFGLISSVLALFCEGWSDCFRTVCSVAPSTVEAGVFEDFEWSSTLLSAEETSVATREVSDSLLGSKESAEAEFSWPAVLVSGDFGSNDFWEPKEPVCS